MLLFNIYCGLFFKLQLQIILLLQKVMISRQPINKLWKQSQLTLNYVTPQLSFSKQKRFKLYSIYWPQEQNSSSIKLNRPISETTKLASRISKLIDDEEKNQSRINKNLTLKQKKPKSIQNFTVKNVKPLKGEQEQIVRRLSQQTQRKQSRLRDKYGFRKQWIQPESDLDQTQGSQQTPFYSSKGFQTSRRIDLNRPHNFYPGPGTYQIKRYLEQHKKNIKNKVIQVQ